jgi:predicted HAD superfamily phosphohydrolase
MYYYNDKIPNLELMTAFLFDEGVVFVHDVGGFVSFSVNCNDYFLPGADSENLSENDIPKLFELYSEKGYDGVYEFVAEKRGCANKHWIKNAY